MHDTQSHGYKDNPHFLSSLLSTAIASWNQPLKPPAPRAAQSTLPDKGPDPKQARDMLCKELNVSP